MGTGQPPQPAQSPRSRCVSRLRRSSPRSSWPHPPVANEHYKAPEYSLSVVEGADTQPEDSIEHVSASVNSKAEVSVSLTHNGLVVEQDTGEGGAWLSQVPQVGDMVTFESQGFTTAVTYDGLPSLESTVCAGSNNFSGQRTARLHRRRWLLHGRAPPQILRHGATDALGADQVLSGSSFGGRLSHPLVSGETVYAVESLTSPLAGRSDLHLLQRERPPGRRLPSATAASSSAAAAARARRGVLEIHADFDRQAASLRMVDARDDQPARDDRRGSLPAQRGPTGVCGDKQT